MLTRKKYSNTAVFAKTAIFFTLFSILIIVMTVHQSESINISTSLTSLEETVRPLPLRNHTWRTIRESNLLYIDKTPFLLKLLDRGKCMILRRPPGFGKTTFIEMAADFFRGKQDMFKELAVEEVGNTKHDYSSGMQKNGAPLPKWKEFPVIHLNFREIPNFNTYEEFCDHYQFLLKSIAETYSVDGSDNYFNFKILIWELHRKFNNTPVFVLVDEYDYPFQHAYTVLNNTELATRMQERLESMFSIIKNSEEVELACFAGVLKFNTLRIVGSGMSVFKDLSFDKDLAEAFGFTENEIRNNLGSYLEQWVRQECTTMNARSASDDPTSPEEKLLDKLRSWYGGYQFSEECDASEVFNPVSTLESLRQQKFSNYHLPAYSLHFIVEIFYKSSRSWDRIINVYSQYLYEICRTSPWINETPWHWWMLSNGYYTISNYKRDDGPCGKRHVTLKFPNKEMEEAMEYNLAMYLPDENKFIHRDYSNEIVEFGNAISNRDTEKAMGILSIFKFQSYINKDPETESKYINPEEMVRRLGFILHTASINYQEGVEFNTDTNSTADGGNLDTLQTTDLKVNYIIKIRTTNNTNETVFPMTKQLVQYSKDHPRCFTHATGNQTNFCFLGLNYVFHEGSEKLNSWVELPFANGVPQYSDVVAEPRDLKQILLDKISS